MPPNWCAGKGACCEMVVDKWLSEEWIQRHNLCRERRLLMQGAPHHQGSRGLPEYKEVWVSHYTFSYFQTQCSAFLTNHCILSLCLQLESHEDQECNEFMAYCMAHKGRRHPTSPTTRWIHPRPTATRASTRASLSTQRWERCSMGTHGIRPPNPFLEKPS